MDNVDTNPLERIIGAVRGKAQGATKLTNYITNMNPTMNVHPIYITHMFIPDYKREAFKRLRLMSHNLKVEVGRWSRTPPEERICQCDEIHIQTEKHVLIDCPLTAPCRERYPMLSFSGIKELFDEST